ncbi:MAG: naphthoate synthase, partial [Dehalococcoidia bacterium]|nr:naphthoate synthase [Dehalococcoidia bacterium]
GDVEWEAWGLREQFNWRYTPDRLMRICRKPIIAQVRGFCIGGSHHMAYLCDFTIAADTAIFGQNGPRVSSPADGYIIPYLARVVGAKKAREMWMLARRYSASEAYDMGLVNKVVPMPKLEEEVDKWCEELLSLSPGCIEVLKASFDDEIDHMPQLGLHSGWMYPDWFEMKECREGVDAFMQKRKPQFWKIRQAEAKARQDNPEPKA